MRRRPSRGALATNRTVSFPAVLAPSGRGLARQRGVAEAPVAVRRRLHREPAAQVESEAVAAVEATAAALAAVAAVMAAVQRQLLRMALNAAVAATMLEGEVACVWAMAVDEVPPEAAATVGPPEHWWAGGLLSVRLHCAGAPLWPPNQCWWFPLSEGYARQHLFASRRRCGKPRQPSTGSAVEPTVGGTHSHRPESPSQRHLSGGMAQLSRQRGSCCVTWKRDVSGRCPQRCAISFFLGG